MPWRECSVMDERMRFVELYPQCEAGTRQLGRAQNSQALDAPVLRDSAPREEYHPVGLPHAKTNEHRPCGF
jgi:hypothetical protein